MTYCYIDTETRSATPIGSGMDLYARDAQLIIATWAIDDGPVQIWDALDDPAVPADLALAIMDHKVIKVAHNVTFDRAIIRYCLGLATPTQAWLCTMAQASAHGLPGSLELLGIVLGLAADEAKLAGDGKLIHVFCVPRADGTFWSPTERVAEWNIFKDYAIRDTVALREIHRRLPTSNFENENLAVWRLDQRINARGFQFDTKLAAAAVKLLEKAKEKSDRGIAEVTKGSVTAVTQRDRLLDYLQTVCGVDIPNLRANEVRELLESDTISPEVRFILEQRLEGSKSSGSKYKKGLQMVGPDGRIRYALKFNGAGRTGRWSGRGYQPHNLPRPSLTVYDS